jgi:hypothetical protein
MQKFMFFLERKVLVKNEGLSMFQFLLAILEIYQEKGSNPKNIDIAKGNLKIIPKKKHGTSK